MSEFLKQKFTGWIDFFTKKYEFERNKNGLSDRAIKTAILIELMKEQVPNENSSHSTR